MAGRMLTALIAAVTVFVAQDGLAQSMSAQNVVVAAAEALGMVRGPARRMDSINTVEFTGNGSLSIAGTDDEWATSSLRATFGISYYIPAARFDLEQVRDDGESRRRILVVRDDEAWNERLPGVDPTPAMNSVAERLRQIHLTPHGVIRAAVENPDAVTISSEAARTVITVEIDGQAYRAVLDDNYRPERVETTIDHPRLGRTVHSATYSNYIDWPKLDVYFPSRIVHNIGDETTLDLTVTEFYQNPYVVFPTPELLNRSSQ